MTIHLAGAIPAVGQDRIREMAAELERHKHIADEHLQLQRQIFAEMEHWLDRAEQVAHLNIPVTAQMVRDSITHRQGKVWDVIEYVVMPNHIHLFFELVRPGLKTALEQFNRWTGHQAIKLLSVEGRFWQDEWFDHWSRSDQEDDRIADYIRQNPVKAGLVNTHEKWPFGSWSPA